MTWGATTARLGERSLGRAPKLELGQLEMIETDQEIRACVGYTRNDSLIAVAFGVDRARVERLRREVEAKPGKRQPTYKKSYKRDSSGERSEDNFRSSTMTSSMALAKKINSLFAKRAAAEKCSVEQAAYSMGMRR
jgi:hypothetical protein